MKKAEIPLGDFMPDAPDFENPGLTKCVNVYPSTSGYSPFLGAVTTALSVSGVILGAKRFNKTDGTRFVVCGTASDLYIIDSTTSTASSLSLSIATTEVFVFEQFGPSIYATTKTGATYVLADIDSDTAFVLASGAPPKANTMARIGDFLFMGDLTDIDASDQSYRVRWSQFNNPDGPWATDVATQASFVDMPTRFGAVTGLSGGDVGVIFQKYGVSRIVYTGDSVAFSKEIIDQERGCASPTSIVQVGPVSYYVAHDGFCRTDGNTVEIISTNKVWGWLVDNIDATNFNKVSGAVNWSKKSVVWAFYGIDQTSFTRQIIYNWERDRWSTSEVEVDYLLEGTQDGFTLEGLATVYPDLDAMTLSLDSAAFKARGRILSCFIGGTLYDFVGNTLEAVFETGDIQPQTGQRTFIAGIVPIVENSSGNTNVAIATRNEPGTTITYGPDVETGPMGFSAFNSDGRLVRVRQTMPAGSAWDKASAIQVEYIESGVG
jgi:hypothetical protein